METVGKQVQVVSGLAVVGPVGGELHHHHHSNPHGTHSHSLSGSASTPSRVLNQSHQGPPPSSHNQHLSPRSAPVQHHRSAQNYINVKSNSPVSPRNSASSGSGYAQASSISDGVVPSANVSGPGTPGSIIAGTASSNFVTVPVPSGLRYMHGYPQPFVSTSSSASVNQTSPPTSGIKVSERGTISVSSSPISQVAIGGSTSDYNLGRSDRPRISLLPSVSVALVSSPASANEYHITSVRNQHGPMETTVDQYSSRAIDISLQEAPPFKKIRLCHAQPQSPCQTTTHSDICIKQEHVQLSQPLRIDTRPATGAYTPQTEAISPTLPETTTQEDAQFRSTKDDLLQQIAKVDREIAKSESQISKLRKKLKELEETASMPLDTSGIKRPVEELMQPKHQSLAQKIYAENRKKSEEAHRLLDKLGSHLELPLYNQPSDTNIYQDNKTRHQTCMRTRLVARLRREHSERASLHHQQSQTYAILVQEWHRKIDRLEAAQKRKSKEVKNREFFEKVFPELRKQREDKERFNRVGARIKSEADLEEIMDGLQEQEMEDKKMRSYAVIPPLLLDAKQRKIAFQNRNGLLQPEELETLHSERKLMNVWNTIEHESFKEKYLQHPKNFGIIAQSLEHKSVQDCVHHYYLTKKAENYKQLLRKSRQRTRSSRNNPNNKVNNTNSSIGHIDILTTGVTTRLQREQQQKTQENPQNNSGSSSTSSVPTTSSVTTSSTTASVTASSTLTATLITTISLSSTSQSPLTTSQISTNTITDLIMTTKTISTSSTVQSMNNVLTTVTATGNSLIVGSSTSSGIKDTREMNKENKDNKENTNDITVKNYNNESKEDTTKKEPNESSNLNFSSSINVRGNENSVHSSDMTEKKKTK